MNHFIDYNLRISLIYLLYNISLLLLISIYFRVLYIIISYDHSKRVIEPNECDRLRI
jgi:hypothetical protein